MEFTQFTIIGWALALVSTGLTAGILLTVLYFRRWRKKVIAMLNTYRVKAERLEKAWNTKETVAKPKAPGSLSMKG